MYFIGVEYSPERTRTVVLNLESATIAAESEKAHGLVAGLPPGHCEQDPLLWIHAVDATVRDCMRQIGEARNRVAGMGVSGQSQGLVALDEANRIVRPAKLRGDLSAESQCEELSRAFGGAPGMIELTGNPVKPAFPVSKISWLKQNEPYHFQRATMLMSPHDFINYWLSGVKRSEFGEASTTGLFDVRERRWCRELCEFIDPRLIEMLPPVRSSSEPLGELRGELARSWGLGETVLLSAGGANEMMGALGAGAAEVGAVSVSVGAGATVGGVSERPVVDPHGEVAAYCDATDRWMPLARNSAAAACAEQVRLHYGWDEGQMEGALTVAEPGAQGLMFLPGMNGSSGPHGHSRSGALVGIDSRNLTAANVARSSLEALALEFGRGLRRMRELGFAPSDVRLSGRGSRHPAWRQLLSDVLGLPVLSARQEASPALGAALQAAVTFFHQSGEDLTYTEITSYAVVPEERSLCAPDQTRHGLYNDLMDRQERLTENLQEDALA